MHQLLSYVSYMLTAKLKTEHHMNWDDLKYFLAVARHGSVRAAAKSLDVNHATVSRRIRQFEDQLGDRLFERTNTGYERTVLADEIYSEALHLEERLNTVSRKVAGRDKQLKGDIRVTLHDSIARNLFMDDFAEFCALHSDIELEIIDSVHPLNLANREADIAFRICKEPPDYLIGRKIANIHRACYISTDKAHEIDSEGWVENNNWISWSDKLRRPAGQIARDYPRFKARHKIMDASLQKEACKAGMGIGILMCFMADNDPALTRIPPYHSEHKYDLWMLYHPDLRSSAKIQSFVQFIHEKMSIRRPLIEGQTYSR